MLLVEPLKEWQMMLFSLDKRPFTRVSVILFAWTHSNRCSMMLVKFVVVSQDECEKRRQKVEVFF